MAVDAQVRSVEASLRLDAVASAGLRISRAKASDLAKNGDLRCGPPEAFQACIDCSWHKRFESAGETKFTEPATEVCFGGCSSKRLLMPSPSVLYTEHIVMESI